MCLLFCCCSVTVSDSSRSPGTAGWQASLSLTISQSLPKCMSTAWVMPSTHLIFFCLFLLLPQSFPASGFFFPSESALHIRWPEYRSFSISISPSREYWGLTSFKTDWFYFRAVQGTLQSLLQHHSLKALIFSALPSLLSSSHIHTWLLEKP